MATDEVRKDLRAAVEARQELGAEYENEIIESFLDKLDARDAQRHGRDLQHRREDQMLEAAGLKRREGSDPGGLALAIVSVTCAIPITAIAADMTGLPGMLISWAGLVGINFAWRTNRRSAG
ncbi:hypothetical protein E1218_08670 [Kribbella turkmenica]|uniref:Integral membrane protein n=1 Tax=Kribbella turkmenica TaxID=2530375 RepID=A0A4V2YGR0_9ACTN|nr:hypothetical protein [Kribbella turkmenica]TDD27997.1 hypothetical protein E1218_08670 [Kribbella turkmenica]